MKVKTFRSQKWLNAVRSIGHCVLCGSTEGIQVAHRNKGKGMGIKTSDATCACLCHRCHHDIDNGNTMTKEERYLLFDEALARTIDQLAHSGKLTVSN